MKKGNLFLLAYILFICISIFIRIKTDYPIWNSLVLAISISSIFFSYETLFSSSCSELERLANNSDDLISIMEKTNASDFKSIEEIKMIYASYNLDCTNLGEIEKCLVNENKINNELKQENKKMKSKMKVFKIISNCFTFLGFLSLLVIMAFSEQTIWLTTYQDIISAFSFVFILSTSLIDDLASKNREKIFSQSREIIFKQEKSSKYFDLLKEKCKQLIQSKQECDFLKTEEQHNAD